MEKIILQSLDKSYLKNEMKKYTDYVCGPITKSGKFFSITLVKK